MKTNYTLNEILAEMKQEEKTTFGNLEEYANQMFINQLAGYGM